MKKNHEILEKIIPQLPEHERAIIERAVSQEGKPSYLGDLSRVYEKITEYPNVKNAFMNVLQNKVGLTRMFSKMHENRLNVFFKGELPFGKSIENVFVDIVDGVNFDGNFTNASGGAGTSDYEDNFGQTQAKIHLEYMTENFKNKYKVSISDEQLKGAFFNQYGLGELISKLVNTPISSSNHDHFRMTKKLLCNGLLGVTGEYPSTAVDATGKTLSEINAEVRKTSGTVKSKYIMSRTTNPSSKDGASQFLIDLQNIIDGFGFSTRQYNSSQALQLVKPNEIYIVTTPAVKNSLNVNTLATLFHIEKAEVASRIILVDSFPSDGVTVATGKGKTIALVVDKDFAQVWTTSKSAESVRNVNKRLTNTIYHDWGILAQLGFMNAVQMVETVSPTDKIKGSLPLKSFETEIIKYDLD